MNIPQLCKCWAEVLARHFDSFETKQWLSSLCLFPQVKKMFCSYGNVSYKEVQIYQKSNEAWFLLFYWLFYIVVLLPFRESFILANEYILVSILSLTVFFSGHTWLKSSLHLVHLELFRAGQNSLRSAALKLLGSPRKR